VKSHFDLSVNCIIIAYSRPMDMRLAIEDLAVIPRGSEPTELQQYVNDLKQ
jgi:hypothetical protein